MLSFLREVDVFQIWETGRLSSRKSIVWRDAVIKSESISHEYSFSIQSFEWNSMTAALEISFHHMHDVSKHSVATFH